MNESGCETCPVKKCDAVYRSSRCAVYRDKYGLGDPKTNADRIRAMSDEEFSCFIALVENRKTGKTSFDDTSDFWLEWLKQPAEGE